MAADLVRMSILAGRHLEALELVFAIGIAGLILTRWTRRGDKREITKFLASTLDAGSP